mgnify:CR=1 FL=1
MSQLFVDNIKGRTGGALGAPSGVNATGVVTATSFTGSGDNLTFSSISASTGTFTGNVSIGGTLTYEDVTNIDSVGIITAQGGLRIGTGGTVGPAGSGIVTYFGDGSNLTGVVSGIEVKSAGSSVGTSLTAINFQSGATVSTGSAGITTITIAAGVTTAYQTPAANALITLNLGTAQYHDIRLTAGITTITCTGGTAGDSHSVVLTQPSSGIATVGFSSYFKFPSGSFPSLSEGSSKIDLVSFVIRTQGATGVSTELLASSGLNYLSQV